MIYILFLFLCFFFSFFFFFFSSRRRHTRCSRDWSSDVCSSDLTTARAERRWRRLALGSCPGGRRSYNTPVVSSARRPIHDPTSNPHRRRRRSEERRVGKECRSRWSPYH